MPKGKRKSKFAGRQKQDSNLASEEESVADTASVVSNVSELRIDSDDDTITEVDDENVLIDNFEDKFKEAIEGTYQKSAKLRIASLEVIKKGLSSKYMGEFLTDRKLTLCDVIERSLKRGKGDEQILAAVVAALFCTQLSSVEDSELVYQTLQPILMVILLDTTVTPSVRAQCASSLGLCCFISCSGAEVVQSTMDSLYSIFSGSLLKGNGVLPVLKPEISSLHSSALLSWNLLLTLLSPPYIMALVNSHFKKLPQLLDSVDVDLRIAAGETLAVFYELARQCREDFEGEDFDSLCEKLRLLATDGQKCRAKRDRRQQRSSFRDILRAIEEGEPPDIRIKLKTETLYIDSWCSKRRYDAFCQILGSGMNIHLKQNELLREIFDLGAPLIDDKPSIKTSKLHRHTAHIANFKARSICRGKERDNKAEDVC